MLTDGTRYNDPSSFSLSLSHSLTLSLLLCLSRAYPTTGRATLRTKPKQCCQTSATHSPAPFAFRLCLQHGIFRVARFIERSSALLSRAEMSLFKYQKLRHRYNSLLALLLCTLPTPRPFAASHPSHDRIDIEYLWREINIR